MNFLKSIFHSVNVQVHGGTTAEDIHKKVEEAEVLAKETMESTEQTEPENSSRPIYTVLFFDEANTTEAIGAIKEVMCDGAMNGKPIKLHQNLKMVAACNPYRKYVGACVSFFLVNWCVCMCDAVFFFCDQSCWPCQIVSPVELAKLAVLHRLSMCPQSLVWSEVS